VSQVEVDDYLTEQKRLINELSSIENQDYKTKTEKLKELIQITRPLVVAGYYPNIKLNDLSSFIRKEILDKYKISYNNSGDYYALFQDDEKHLEKSNLTSRSRQKISSPLAIEKRTGDKVVDILKEAQMSGMTMPDNYEYHVYLEQIINVSNETIKQAESLIRKLGHAFYFVEIFDRVIPNKRDLQEEIQNTTGKRQKELEELYTYYHESKKVIQDIESGIGSTNDKIDELNETLSTQKFISKQIDERSKITFLEKWNCIVANIEIGVSAIAKKLGINKKHITNNIRPKENPVTGNKNMHHDYIDWFRHIQVVSPSGEKFVFDAKNYFDQQIERGKLNVPFQPMILKNCEID
jgi:DNA-binding phage protein